MVIILFYIFCAGYNINCIKAYNSNGNLYKSIGNNNEDNKFFIEMDEINENKYIISGSDKGINVLHYP